MTIDYLALSLRMLHIMAAMTAVGGSIFLRTALIPALPTIDDPARATLHEAIRRRWAMVVGIAIGILLLSGLANFMLFMRAYKEWGDVWREAYAKPYNILFGVKFLLAFVMFFLASALAGRSSALQWVRNNAKLWITVNLAIAFAIVVISGLMRQTHFGPTAPAGYKTTFVEAGVEPALPAADAKSETPANPVADKTP
ncbi:MAG: hypothetical protein QM811_03060 [Pirellulales bacterium]